MATPLSNDGERTRPPILLKKSKSLEKAVTQESNKTKCFELYPRASHVRRVLKKSQSAMAIHAEDVEGEMKEEASTSRAQPGGPATAGPYVMASELQLGGPKEERQRPVPEPDSGRAAPNPP